MSDLNEARKALLFLDSQDVGQPRVTQALETLREYLETSVAVTIQSDYSKTITMLADANAKVREATLQNEIAALSLQLANLHRDIADAIANGRMPHDAIAP